MEWLKVGNNWVLTPPKAKAVIHFLGGAFLATNPQVTYKKLLENLADNGFAIVATPFLNTFDHRQIAQEVHASYREAENKLFLDYFPAFGMGHSMGCKIHLLMDSWFDLNRSGNIFLAYNNYSAYRSIPFLANFMQTLPEIQEVEFTPSPEETLRLIEASYNTQLNLLIDFEEDDIDEIPALAELLERKFSPTVKVNQIAGNHLTPVALDVNWRAGQVFTPLDAIGQWMKQNWNETMNRENMELSRLLRQWLNTHIPTRV